MKRRIRLALAGVVVAAAATAIVGGVAARPAAATPRNAACSSCHSLGTAGTVTAVPDTSTPAPGAAYHVQVGITTDSSANGGYWITTSGVTGNPAGTTDPNKVGGPDPQTSWSVAMTAPSTAGTYTYKVWGARGSGSTGKSQSTTFSITVQAAPPGPDTTAPTIKATGAAANGWFKVVNITLTATDNSGGSGVASITYSIDGGAATTVNGASTLVPVTGIDGPHTVTFHATDVATNAGTGQSLTVNLDTVKPVTKASAATVKAGKLATLKYQVTDAAPNGGTARATIKIKNKAGKVVKTIPAKTVKVNVALTAKFTCKLKKGTYKYVVTATDKAGNKAAAASAKLTVK